MTKQELIDSIQARLDKLEVGTEEYNAVQAELNEAYELEDEDLLVGEEEPYVEETPVNYPYADYSDDDLYALKNDIIKKKQAILSGPSGGYTSKMSPKEKRNYAQYNVDLDNIRLEFNARDIQGVLVDEDTYASAFDNDWSIKRTNLEKDLIDQGVEKYDIEEYLRAFDENYWDVNRRAIEGTLTNIKTVTILDKTKFDFANAIPEDGYNTKVAKGRSDVVNWLNDYVSHRGFKVEATHVDRTQGQFIKIIAANGNSVIFNTKKIGKDTTWTSQRTGVTSGKRSPEANSLSEITDWLNKESKNITQNQKYIFDLTNLAPIIENGESLGYDVQIKKKQIKKGRFDMLNQQIDRDYPIADLNVPMAGSGSDNIRVYDADFRSTLKEVIGEELAEAYMNGEEGGHEALRQYFETSGVNGQCKFISRDYIMKHHHRNQAGWTYEHSAHQACLELRKSRKGRAEIWAQAGPGEKYEDYFEWGTPSNVESEQIMHDLVHKTSYYIKKALINPEKWEYLTKKYSSIGIQNISEDDKQEIRQEVWEKVTGWFNTYRDVYIEKKQFNELFVMFDKILGTLQRRNTIQRSLQVTGKTLSKKVKEERKRLYLKGLTDKEKYKYDKLIEIRNLETQLRYAIDEDEIKELESKIEVLEQDIEENAKEIQIISTGTAVGVYEGRNNRLGSMMMNNGMVNSTEEVDALVDDITDEARTSIANLHTQGKVTQSMTDWDVIEMYHDNVILRRLKVEEEFRDRKVTLKLDKLYPGANGLNAVGIQGNAVAKKLLEHFPQAGEMQYDNAGDFVWVWKNPEISISVTELYELGFRPEDFEPKLLKKDEPGLAGSHMSLFQDYNQFRIKAFAEEQVLKNMLYLNIDPIDVKEEIGFWSGVRDGLFDATRHTFGVVAKEGDALTARDQLNHMQAVTADINSWIDSTGGTIKDPITGDVIKLNKIQWDPKMYEAFRVDWNERLGNTFGGFIPMAVELSLLSAATGGVLSFSGAARIIQRWRSSGRAVDKFKAIMTNVGIEEFKMHGVMGFHPGDGTTFALIGEATHGINLPKSWGAASILFQKTLKTGMVGATSMDVAQVVAMSIDHLNANKLFREEFDKYFGDMSENAQRWLMNAAAFSFHGLHTVRGSDFRGNKYTESELYAQKEAVISELNKDMNSLFTMVRHPETGAITRKWGKVVDGKVVLDAKTAQSQWEAMSVMKEYMLNMQKGHKDFNALDPKVNPNFEITARERFGANSDLQLKLKKENPEYPGFDIKFSKNPADFSNGNSCVYVYGKGSQKPYILINTNTYKPGKFQHEAYIHAVVDAYFRGGEGKRKRVFVDNIAEKFKGLDFSPYLLETRKGTREFKIAEILDKYYKGERADIKSEEFLGYLMEFLAKPYMYKQMVAKTGFHSAMIDIRTMLRENFNLYQDVKSPKEVLEIMAVLSQGAESGKWNPKTFDAFIKGIEKYTVDVQEAGWTKNNPTSNLREMSPSKDLEFKGLVAERNKLIDEKLELDKIPTEQLTSVQKSRKAELDVWIESYNNQINSPKFVQKSPIGEVPFDLSRGRSDKEMIDVNTKITSSMKDPGKNAIKENGTSLSFNEIGGELKAIENSLRELVSKHYKDGQWSGTEFKSEFDLLQKRKLDLETVQSLKYDLVENNLGAIEKIVNQLHSKGANVDVQERIPLESKGGEMGLRERVLIEVNTLIDSYRFKIEKRGEPTEANPKGEIIMKNGKPVMIDNPVPFLAYIRAQLPLRYGNMLKDLMKGKDKIVSPEFDFDKTAVETGLGEGTYTSPTSPATLITVKNDLKRNGETVVTPEIESKMNASFSNIDFSVQNYKTLRNPDVQFTKDLFGKTTQDKVNFIGENALLIYNSLPKNVSEITGKATGIQNSILKYFYEKGDRVSFKETGTGDGNPIQNKRKMTADEFLAVMGITRKVEIIDGKSVETFVIDKSNPEFRNLTTSTFPALSEQMSRIIYNQQAREYIMKNPDKYPVLAENTTLETILHEISSGKSESVASKDLTELLIESGHAKDIDGVTNIIRLYSQDIYNYRVPVEFERIYGPDITSKITTILTLEAQKVADLGKVDVKIDPTKQKVTDHLKTTDYNKPVIINGKQVGGLSGLSVAAFKNNPEAQKQYKDITMEICQEIFLGKGADQASVRLFQELFNSHYKTTGDNNIATGEFITGLRNAVIVEGKSRFSPEILERLQNIDFSTFKSPYASSNVTLQKKIDAAVTVEKKMELIQEYYKSGEGKTSLELYDVWNTILEQYVHRNKDGSPTEKYLENGDINPQWAVKMDYVAMLKKMNAEVGKQGERTLAYENSIFIGTGKYEVSKNNPEYKVFYKEILADLKLKGKLKGDALTNRASELALNKLKNKVEHIRSSNEQSITSLLLIENNQFHSRGKEGMDNYTSILGKKGHFDIIDQKGGKINTSGIFRFSYELELAKQYYTIESIIAGKPKSIYQELISKIGEKTIKSIEAEAARQNIENISILEKNGIKPSTDPIENIRLLQDLNNNVSKETQAASKDLSADFNLMMEGNYGIGKHKTYSEALARTISMKRKWYQNYKDWFVGSNADDFKGLTNYRLVNKSGKEGEAQQQFYNDNLHIPYAMGVNALNVAKNRIQTEYKDLNKNFKSVAKILNKDVPGEIFSNANAIRVYLWNRAGHDMTQFGLSKKDNKKLVEIVENNPDLKAYAEQLSVITGRKNGYVEPDAFWLTQGIKHDLLSITSGKGREHFLGDFINNVDVIFSQTNLNKIEAIHGKKYRDNLERTIHRMKTGTNRVFGKTDKMMNEFSDWVNGSVGVTMFLNTRSAVLQTLSATNYMDWGPNNPLKSAKAFANQKQYWKDYAMIINSPFAKERFGGLKTDVNHAELAQMSKKGGAKGVLGGLLSFGFLPTKLADMNAIAMGGATFYRNHYNHLLKMSEIKNNPDPIGRAWYALRAKSTKKVFEKKLHEEAWRMFIERTTTTQQSSDPSKISEIQASGLGRLVFAFQNTPMQYTREMKKSILDLTYRRGDAKHNISKILYYGAAQNLLFGALQNALFTSAFDDDEVKLDTKTQRTLNGMLDTILRGSGMPGAVFSTLKNTFLKFGEEEKKGWNADHAQTLIQASGITPPISIKARKLYSSMKDYKINKEIIPHMGLKINNPAFSIAGNFTAAVTNFPLDRVVQKSNNVREILSGDHQWWQNMSLLAGYRPYDIGIVDEEKTEAKEVVKEEKEIIKEKKKEEKKKIEEKEKIKEGEEKQKQEEKEGKQVTCLVCKNPVVKGKKYCTVHEKKPQNETGEQKRCKHKYPKGHNKEYQQCGVMTANKSGLCPYHD